MPEKPRQAKTRRGKRHLEKRAPKVNENPKSIIYFHGHRCSQIVQQTFKDLHELTRQQSKIYSRKHDTRPMEDHTELETMAKKFDVSLFLVGTSNKKRPDTITFARMFNHHLLDMAEARVMHFKPMHKFKGLGKPAAMSKPALIFQGHCWEHDGDMRLLKNLLADVFRGPVVERINLAGLDRALVFTAEESRICMRQYRIDQKKTAAKQALIELEECGPSLDLQVGRTVHAAEDVMKQALRRPKQLVRKKPKNVEYSELGERIGRVHIRSQNVHKMQLRKVKALKPSAKERGDAKGANKPKRAKTAAE